MSPVHTHACIQPSQQGLQLGAVQFEAIEVLAGRGPAESPAFESLRANPQSRPIPMKRLYPIASPIAEHEYVTIGGILAELVIDDRIQRIEALSHIGDPAGEPDASRAARAQHGEPSSRAKATAERSSASRGKSKVVPPGKRIVAIASACPPMETSINPSPRLGTGSGE